jgi:hypothetical protein
MDTNCAPLLADLFIYSYEAEFVQNLLYRSTTIISIHVSILYTPSELEIKDTTESSASASDP